MLILGIETSCDETGIALYDSNKGLLGHTLHSQIDLHAEYGGVVPELASRDHIRYIIPLINQLLNKTSIAKEAINAIAYTAGPGLSGALLVGSTVGESLSFALGIPSIPVHHLEGHLLAPMLEDTKPVFPFLALLVSGGHTQIIHVKQIGQYDIVGDTLDDALKRARAYVKAGADGVMIHSKDKSGDDIKSFCLKFREEDLTTPIVVVPSSYNHIKEEELISWGANIVIYANHLLRASFPSMQNVAESILKNKRTSELDDKCMSIKEILELIPGTK